LKVDQNAVAGIHTKIDRAHEHLTVLMKDITRYNHARPYRITKEVNADGTKHTFRFWYTEPIPALWGVLVGEAVHDLRSGLDQVLYQLTRHWKVTLEDTQFPIFTKRAKFEGVTPKKYPTGGAPGSGRHWLRGVGPGPSAFIEQLQPYPQRRNLIADSICHLHELWNQDKHRLYHLWGVRFGNEQQLQIGRNNPASRFVVNMPSRILNSGAIVMRITFSHPEPHMQVRGETPAEIAMRPAKKRRGGGESLWTMFWNVERVIMSLTRALGNQHEPIPMPMAARRAEPLRVTFERGDFWQIGSPVEWASPVKG
jgi:hypothetical protein